MELNEQTLEQILTRQREEYQRHAELQRKEFQRHLDEGLEETRRHVGVLVERAEHKIELIAEGHEALRQDIGGMREQLTDLQERVTHIEGHVAAIHDMGAKNTQDIVVIRVDMETIKSDIAIIRHDLKDKAGREELMVLESRVAELERTVRSK